MPPAGGYEPSPVEVVRDQVARYEGTDGEEGGVGLDSGLPIIVVTMRGRFTCKIRKAPLMRIEHAGSYALVASNNGAEQHPHWYHNFTADPSVTVQDGPQRFVGRVRELHGAEREEWWQRAVAAYPQYAIYQSQMERIIPVLLIERI
jgi:deazaflavin-dependent oxidoreductase (nitroreductase family)